LWEKAQSDEDEQKKNKGGTRGRFHEGDLSVVMARWRNGFESSSLREHESRSCDNNRGTGPCHRATPRVTVSFIFLIWPSSPPLVALSTLAHHFPEPPAPHLINQKLLTPPSAINLKPVTRNKTLIAVVWAASKRLSSSHVNPFSGPHEAEPQRDRESSRQPQKEHDGLDLCSLIH